MTKRLVLGDGPGLRTDYRVTNEGRRELPFLWKSHVAVRLHSDTAVAIAAGDVLVHEFGGPRVRPGGNVRLAERAGRGGRARLPSAARHRGDGVTEFLIATSLERGSAASSIPGRHRAALAWDAADLPSCWTFASYGGGWRGLDVLVLEPCTGHPLSVAEGVAAGTHQVLPAGATKEWSLTARVGVPAPAGADQAE